MDSEQQLCVYDEASLPSTNECAKETAFSCKDEDKVYATPSAPNGISTEATEEGDGTSCTSETNTKLDMLRFKNNFLKMVEELRLRRHLNSENEQQIENLLIEKHELSHKLDEAVSCNSKLTESHNCEIQEMMKKNEEQIQHYLNEQAKYSMVQDSRELELKALKDEMKALHLTKHVLEKKVQEQERQIQLQNSFRENYQSKMTQLEEKCSALQKLAEDTTEEVASLDGSVEQAKALHQKLVFVNQHLNCELAAVKGQLKACRQELVESRAHRRDPGVGSGSMEGRCDSEASQAKQRATEQELKLQVELCRHVQSQLQSLRGEYQEVLLQLKEAHTLLERHADSATRAMEGQEDLHNKLEVMKAEVERLEAKSSLVEEDLKQKEERNAHDKEVWSKKMADTEHRLTTLQSDYKVLQDSYDSLQADKLSMQRDHQVEIENLRSKCSEMEREKESLEDTSKEFKAVESNLKEQIKNLQRALDQSELQLAKTEEELQLKKSSKVENEIHLVMASGRDCSTEFSPEVITSMDGDNAQQVESDSGPISPAAPKTLLPGTSSATKTNTAPYKLNLDTPTTASTMSVPCETCPATPPLTGTTAAPREALPATPPFVNTLVPTVSPPTNGTLVALQETPPLPVSIIMKAAPSQPQATRSSPTPVSGAGSVQLTCDLSAIIASNSTTNPPPATSVSDNVHRGSTLDGTSEYAVESIEISSRNTSSQEHNIELPNAAKRLKLGFDHTFTAPDLTSTAAQATAPDSTHIASDHPPPTTALVVEPVLLPAVCRDQATQALTDEVEMLEMGSGVKAAESGSGTAAGEGAENVGGAAEADMCIMFSPESDEGKEESMLSTQINKQIHRVEMFLKMDRLRKRK